LALWLFGRTQHLYQLRAKTETTHFANDLRRSNLSIIERQREQEGQRGFRQVSGDILSRCILTGQERSQNNKKTKNMVRGRYLATFSSNPFAISEKLVAALVSGRGFGSDLWFNQLLAVSNWQTRRSTFTTCCYVATTRVNSGEKQRTGKPKENMLATV